MLLKMIFSPRVLLAGAVLAALGVLKPGGNPLGPSIASAQASQAVTCPKRFADPSPRGNIAGWITTNDYPSRALREEREDVIKFRVNVGPDGRVENVEILEAIQPDLAAATADVLRRRGRFNPALRNCQPVPGEYEGVLRWAIPQ